MRYARAILRALLIAVAILAVTPASAPAPTPPKGCGYVKAKGKRYQVKADVIRCRTARTYVRAYFTSRATNGFTCETYETGSVKLYCHRGTATFFAIRR